MSEGRRCPSCGAANPEGAAWCGQCFALFDEAESAADSPSASRMQGPSDSPVKEPSPAHAEATPPVEEAGAPATPHLELVKSGPIARKRGQLQWTCPACDTENTIDASVCVVCSTPLAALFGATPKQPLKRVGSTALALSAILPGLGHGWAGRIGDAVARGVLFCWTLGVGLLLVTRRGARSAGTFRAIGAVFIIAAISVWIVSLLESQRLSRGDVTGLVPGRALMWVSAALTAVLLVGLAVGTQSR